MRNLFAFLLCLIMLISLVSCGSSEDPADPSQNNNTYNTPTQDSNAELAMELYEAAINDEICVIDERVGEI